jgi:UDP-glucose 4-epimerase
MHVLVTGGSGYIGSHVSRLLAQRGDTVVVVDDFRTGVRARVGDFEALELDLAGAGSSERVADFMVQHRVDSVIHFAARKQVAESVAYPLRYMRDNIVGLAAVLNAVTQVGVARFLFSSSAAVYGDVSGVVDEAAICDPVNPYGRSKLAGEWLTAATAQISGVNAISLRYFNVAGAGWPDLADEAVLNLVPMVIERLRNEQNPRIFGDDYVSSDGTCVRDFVHVLDVAKAHLAALDGMSGSGQGSSLPHRVFNVGSGSGSSVREVIEGIRSRWVNPMPTLVESRRPGDPAVVVADPSRIRRELGWQAQFGLDDILDSVVAGRAPQGA